MKFSAINIQGNIFSGEILEKIRNDDIKYQQIKDFELLKNTTVREEINLAWAAARAHWSAFVLRRDRLTESETGTSQTRQSWMIPFLRELGYTLEKSNAEVINGKTYAISHRAVNRDGFPVHIVGINETLDKRPETGTTRLSPHALIQEYLNNHEHLFALTTNGRFLRLLRDATRLSRLSFLEFDLERIMEEELFGEFALLYRLLHVTRMPEKQHLGDESIIEEYHQDSLASGSRIREKLSEAVEHSLKLLANGLINHRSNTNFREDIKNQEISADDYYLYLLRMVYRMLFLLVIEERHLIYANTKDPETQKKRNIYYRYYSLNRLTALAEKQIYIDPHKSDLWKSLMVTFQIFENERFAEKLNIKPLGSGLFAADALGELENQTLDNGTLLKVLNLLVSFENENKQRVRVNYADLDVEEFGSVYEGLLEYDPAFKEVNGQPAFTFIKGDQRSRSGSHYTPEELVKPLLEHSLEYLIKDCIEKPKSILSKNGAVIVSNTKQSQTVGGNSNFPLPGNKKSQQESALLSLKVADVACGSGHILLSSARRIGLELARVRSNEDQPSPPIMRQATRDVIRNCIYGVDLNPLAVELCKVALWLEAHSPGEPLNFLDHHIKCGNAIVGLAHKEELQNGIPNEAFKTLPGDEKKIAQALRKTNKKERERKGQIQLNFDKVVEDPLHEILEKWEAVNTMPERTPEEITKKETAYRSFANGPKWWRLKTLADLPVAQFFIPKTDDNHLTTDGLYREFLRGSKSLQCREASNALAVSNNKRFFHWFLEFPEVFSRGGFDCIVGNPPYLGGRNLTVKHGFNYSNYLKSQFKNSEGNTDLVAFFGRRIHSIVKEESFYSFITTKSIYQGDTRVSYLKKILDTNTNHICFGLRSKKWPGKATVVISIIAISKNKYPQIYILDNKPVKHIDSFLKESSGEKLEPVILDQNIGQSYKGSEPAKDFMIDKNIGQTLINESVNYKDVIKYYLNGNDLNNNINQEPSRYVINFYNWPLDKAKKYSKAFEIIENVKMKWLKNTDHSNTSNWWWHRRRSEKLYKNIINLDFVLTVSFTSKYGKFSISNSNYTFSNSVVIICMSKINFFSILNSTIHESWAWKFSSTMGDAGLRYTPSSAFETFPFPQKILSQIEYKLETIGKDYHNFRQQLMQKIQLGLTKTYNAFHAREIQPGITAAQLVDKNKKAVTKEYGKEVWNLWSHLQKTDGTCSMEEAIADIVTLRQLHKEMDEAVLEAYGWHTDSDKWGPAIDLAHDFYEVDYLPENDRVRYTISPTARKEVLKRLLLLNHEIFEEEVRQGLHKKKDVEKFYAQKGEPVPDGTVFSDRKGKKKKRKKKDDNEKQVGLF